MLFIHSGTDIAKAFGVELISSPEMSSALTNWDRISTGKPPWLNAEDEIGTINMPLPVSPVQLRRGYKIGLSAVLTMPKTARRCNVLNICYCRYTGGYL